MPAPNSRSALALPVLLNGVGFGIVAISGFAFLAVTDRHSAGPDEAALLGFYFLVTTVLLGISAGVEHGTSRRLAFTIAAGGDVRRAVLTSIRDAAGLVAGTAALLCAAAPVLVPRTLRGATALFVVLLLGLLLAGTSSLVRGLLVGARRFRPYAMTWAAEGLFRIALVGLVAAFGSPATWGLGGAYVVPFALSAAVGLVALGRLAPSTAPDSTDVAQPVARAGMVSLAGAGLLTLGVANLPILILGTRDLDASARVVAFGHVFVLARLALTALAPVQSVLLPGFTAAVARHDFAGLSRSLRRFSLACAGAALGWVAIITVLGPAVAAVLFPGSATSRTLFLLLSLGTVAMAIGTPLQLALTALGAYRWVTAGWATGVVTTAACALWPWLTPITGATLAAMIGPGAAILTMQIGVRATLRARRDQPERESGQTVETPEPPAVAQPRSGRPG